MKGIETTDYFQFTFTFGKPNYVNKKVIKLQGVLLNATSNNNEVLDNVSRQA